MKRFLRYGSRHCLWFPRGYEGKTKPELNPLSSCSHGANGKRTWYLYEPLWAFRLRKRLFAFAGNHRCARRDESWIGMREKSALPDSWNIMPLGERTCSYCGSLHPQDMARLVAKCVDSEGADVEVEPSDKNYKVYVHQKGVRNAGEGGIKFYMWHVDTELMGPVRQAEYSKAVKLTRAYNEKKREEWLARLQDQKSTTPPQV